MKWLLQLCVLALLFGSILPCYAGPSLVDYYRKALAADPQNPTLRYHLGDCRTCRAEAKIRTVETRF